jgi:hypothetical protein
VWECIRRTSRGRAWQRDEEGRHRWDGSTMNRQVKQVSQSHHVVIQYSSNRRTFDTLLLTLSGRDESRTTQQASLAAQSFRSSSLISPLFPHSQSPPPSTTLSASYVTPNQSSNHVRAKSGITSTQNTPPTPPYLRSLPLYNLAVPSTKYTQHQPPFPKPKTSRRE